MAHPKLEAIRQRYDYRCGCCHVSEVDAGGELTVDHYHPVSAGGGDQDDNLVYSCMRCNLHKSDFVPTEQDNNQGRRVLHPLLDDMTAHIRENRDSGHLEPLIETGRFHILLLRLNRAALVEHRYRKRLAELTEAKLQNLTEENALLRAAMLIQRAFLPKDSE